MSGCQPILLIIFADSVIVRHMGQSSRSLGCLLSGQFDTVNDCCKAGFLCGMAADLAKWSDAGKHFASC